MVFFKQFNAYIALFMIKSILFSGVFICMSLSVYAQETYQVKGRFLYDPCGEQVVLRGVNEMFIWSGDLSGEITLPEIAKTGANVVRLVWMTDEDSRNGTAENLDKLIAGCIAANMIPMPELHGATGKWENLSAMVDYWVRPDVTAVLKKYEKYLLINIANEAGDWQVTDQEFRSGYEEAVRRIRNTGIKAPLVIDAAGWGQSIDILQANAAYLTGRDPEKNLLFSVHMWWVAKDNSTKRIVKEIRQSVNMDLPLIVGEFAPMGTECRKGIDYKTIMKECRKYDIGWLAWSWGFMDNGDCIEMDMTSDSERGKFSGLTGWGLEVAVTDPNSIRNTSKRSSFIQNKGECNLKEN